MLQNSFTEIKIPLREKERGKTLTSLKAQPISHVLSAKKRLVILLRACPLRHNLVLSGASACWRWNYKN